MRVSPRSSLHDAADQLPGGAACASSGAGSALADLFCVAAVQCLRRRRPDQRLRAEDKPFCGKQGINAKQSDKPARYSESQPPVPLSQCALQSLVNQKLPESLILAGLLRQAAQMRHQCGL